MKRDDNQSEFNWDGRQPPHEMTCPTCMGRGKVPYTPESSHRARSSDPVTSHDGVKSESDIGSFGPDSWRGKLLIVLGTKPIRNFTREEAANEVTPRDRDHGTFETARKRMSELLAVKYIIEVLKEDGTPETRPNPWSNRESEVLIITPLGEMALKHMLDTGRTR